jgi:16S rRNA (guanine966-N2)-methyltransferase
LQFELADQRCLDLFSGSGALGFEALSRGASQVIMIEKDAQASQLLSRHATTLNQVCNGQALVQRNDATTFLAQQPDATWDVVFIDPPFKMGLAEQCIELLERQQWLHQDSWIYLETEQEWQPQVPAHWQLHREKMAGQVAYRLYYVGSPLN